MLFATSERLKPLLIRFEKPFPVVIDGVRVRCPGVVETVDWGVVTSWLAEARCVFNRGPGMGDVSPSIVFVDELKGTVSSATEALHR